MMMDSQISQHGNEDDEVLTDTERLADLYEQIHDLIEICVGTKDDMKDLDNWAAVHDLEFQLELTAEGLRRYLEHLRNLKND